MTDFHQWSSSKRLNTTPGKLAIEAIWEEMIGAGVPVSRVRELLTDLLDNFRETRP
jgi:hypothetical protein